MDDLLPLEALHDELGDGFDGSPTETVFDDANWSLDRHSRFGASCGQGVYVGEDKVPGAQVVELGMVLAFEGGGSRLDVGGVAVKALMVKVETAEAGAPYVVIPREARNSRRHHIGREALAPLRWVIAKGTKAFTCHLALGITKQCLAPLVHHANLHRSVQPSKLPELGQS